MRKALLVVSLFLALIVGYTAAGPYLTISAIKTGIVEQNSETLSEHIDFPIFRQNIKEQFNAVMMKTAVTNLDDNPFAALATGLVATMIDKVVDSFITPSGLAMLMKGKNPSENEDAENKSEQKAEELFKNAKYSYDSLSTFSVWVPNDNGKDARFVLRRDFLSWKLVNIELPILTKETYNVDSTSEETNQALGNDASANKVEKLEELSLNGKWETNASVNQIDDTETAFAILEATSGVGRYGNKVRLIARCKSNKTEVFVNWDSYLGMDSTDVVSRIGANKAEKRSWLLSTDRNASFIPKPIQFLKQMMEADKLVLQTVPYGQNQITAIFDTTGLSNAIIPLREACNW